MEHNLGKFLFSTHFMDFSDLPYKKTGAELHRNPNPQVVCKENFSLFITDVSRENDQIKEQKEFRLWEESNP